MEGVRVWQGEDSKKHKGLLVARVNDFDVIDCVLCGFKHVTPIPTPEDLFKVYSHEYYMVDKPLYSERYLEDKEWWDSVYSSRYDIFEKYLSVERRKILDVGSGPGFFLLNGKDRGWEVKGVEPSSKAASYSCVDLGLDVYEGFLEKNNAEDFGKFDAINMSLVLEHLPDPSAMLKVANGMLNDDGIICVVVPNDFNPFQLVARDQLGLKPWWIAPPHHINYFDYESLACLFNKTGFEVVHKEATFPIDMFVLMGENYIGEDDIGRRCHGYRKEFEKNLILGGGEALKSELYEKLSDMGIGREVVLFGRKVN